MILLLVVCLGLAAVLLAAPPLGAPARLRRTGASGPAPGPKTSGQSVFPWRLRGAGKGTEQPAARMTLVVQQLAALLKGGRTPARLWEEIWDVYGSSGSRAPGLSPGSSAMLAAARSAASRGIPVSEAIRRASPSAFPLADVLTRFAAQLEVEDDADAARQTALAGPKATVSLLTWLPLLGLGLGIALGVDPLAILLGTPWGLAALAAGAGLTVAGRLWSARLVAAAAGAGAP